MGKKVNIIGSGFSSLSAASYLAKAGFDVEVFEKNQTIGGRARQLKRDGFTFDIGPTWYWMPDVFERFFKDFGKKPSDYYKLEKLDPAYSDPAYPERITDYSTQPNWWYDEKTWTEFITYCERMDHPNERENEPGIRWGSSKLAFKVQPYHEFFGPDMSYEQAKEACRFVLKPIFSPTAIASSVVPIFEHSSLNLIKSIFSLYNFEIS